MYVSPPLPLPAWPENLGHVPPPHLYARPTAMLPQFLRLQRFWVANVAKLLRFGRSGLDFGGGQMGPRRVRARFWRPKRLDFRAYKGSVEWRSH